VCTAAALAAGGQPLPAKNGEFEIRVVDHDSGEPVAVRMHLKNSRGRAFRPRLRTTWHDHFTFDGKVVLNLPPGDYTFQMERGPEYRIRSGHFTIKSGATDNTQVDMHRFIHMKQAGWWSGDLHVERARPDIPLLMKAEDLHVLPVITWSEQDHQWAGREPPASPLVRLDEDRFYHLLGGRSQQSGGTLLLFQTPRPLTPDQLAPQHPSPLHVLAQVAAWEKAHVDIETPFAWDLPLWVATGQIDSVGLAHSHLWRSGGLDEETGGKPRDRVRYPPPYGNGRWSEVIYHRLLECGLRLPPTAGSGSGLRPTNPVGYNRVYVHCGPELTYDQWWQNLRAGRVVVTNGPLMQPAVNGQPPGHVFRGYADEPLELTVALQLATRDKIDYLEIVKNAEVVEHVRLDQWAEAGGKLPPITFQRSGWLLVRALTSEETTYRFATSGPYYVQIDDQPRISRRAAQFFVDWVYERARQIHRQEGPHRDQILQMYRAARDYWQDLVDRANCP
jgi:hypothetical protein